MALIIVINNHKSMLCHVLHVWLCLTCARLACTTRLAVHGMCYTSGCVWHVHIWMCLAFATCLSGICYMSDCLACCAHQTVSVMWCISFRAFNKNTLLVDSNQWLTSFWFLMFMEFSVFLFNICTWQLLRAKHWCCIGFYYIYP